MTLRIGIASIQQETNTWSPVACTLDDFVSQGLVTGPVVRDRYEGTNTEIGGAIRAVVEARCTPVPLVRAWANSSGRVTAYALEELRSMLVATLRSERIDGLVLALHGAMAADGRDDADVEFVRDARAAVGSEVPIGVSFDLHANVTAAIVRAADTLTGYHTYPHTDLEETGARAARFVIARLAGTAAPVTRHAKRPMLIPAEAMSTSNGPMARLRARADELTTGPVLDVSLFPVQPWLDIEELGFGVTVTSDGDASLAKDLAEQFAQEAWGDRGAFTVELLDPRAAIETARRSDVRPFIISESADAPTAGAVGDSPAMVRALLEDGDGLVTYATITDPRAVERCFEAGQGARVDVEVGCYFEKRFHDPVELSGVIETLGDGSVRLTGPSYTGMEFSMGRFAVVRRRGLHLLISERPAFTLDPATFAHAGLKLEDADVIVVRSALGFAAAFPSQSVEHAVILDLPGASTPRLDLLEFSRAPRPLYPIDPGAGPTIPNPDVEEVP